MGQKKSRKIPSKFPANFYKFPCEKSKKNSPTSFCRSAGRRNSVEFRHLYILTPLRLPPPQFMFFWLHELLEAATARSLTICVFPAEPQSLNSKNINLQKKWGFRRFQKECHKRAENRTSCVKSAQRKRKKCAKNAQKCSFLHYLALFLESAETLLILQINVFGRSRL